MQDHVPNDADATRIVAASIQEVVQARGLIPIGPVGAPARRLSLADSEVVALPPFDPYLLVLKNPKGGPNDLSTFLVSRINVNGSMEYVLVALDKTFNDPNTDVPVLFLGSSLESMKGVDLDNWERNTARLGAKFTFRRTYSASSPHDLISMKLTDAGPLEVGAFKIESPAQGLDNSLGQTLWQRSVTPKDLVENAQLVSDLLSRPVI